MKWKKIRKLSLAVYKLEESACRILDMFCLIIQRQYLEVFLALSNVLNLHCIKASLYLNGSMWNVFNMDIRNIILHSLHYNNPIGYGVSTKPSSKLALLSFHYLIVISASSTWYWMNILIVSHDLDIWYQCVCPLLHSSVLHSMVGQTCCLCDAHTDYLTIMNGLIGCMFYWNASCPTIMDETHSSYLTTSDKWPEYYDKPWSTELNIMMISTWSPRERKVYSWVCSCTGLPWHSEHLQDNGLSWHSEHLQDNW